MGAGISVMYLLLGYHLRRVFLPPVSLSDIWTFCAIDPSPQLSGSFLPFLRSHPCVLKNIPFFRFPEAF
jgi:hypothetical protein